MVIIPLSVNNCSYNSFGWFCHTSLCLWIALTCFIVRPVFFFFKFVLLSQVKGYRLESNSVRKRREEGEGGIVDSWKRRTRIKTCYSTKSTFDKIQKGNWIIVRGWTGSSSPLSEGTKPTGSNAFIQSSAMRIEPDRSLSCWNGIHLFHVYLNTPLPYDMTTIFMFLSFSSLHISKVVEMWAQMSSY